MRTRTKSQVRFAPPIFQVMPRFKSRLPPVRNLVVMISRRAQRLLRHLIKLRHLIFARPSSGAVLPSPLPQYLVEPSAPSNISLQNRSARHRQITPSLYARATVAPTQ